MFEGQTCYPCRLTIRLRVIPELDYLGQSGLLDVLNVLASVQDIHQDSEVTAYRCGELPFYLSHFISELRCYATQLKATSFPRVVSLRPQFKERPTNSSNNIARPDISNVHAITYILSST